MNTSFQSQNIILIAFKRKVFLTFVADAMENWGLVTYRETALLVDEGNSSAITRQLVAIVVGHELAHQWFGNLVTMVSTILEV